MKCPRRVPQPLRRVIQRACFIAVVVIDEPILAARYRRHYTVRIDDYRFDARRLRRDLAKLGALLWCDFGRYEYLRSLDLVD